MQKARRILTASVCLVNFIVAEASAFTFSDALIIAQENNYQILSGLESYEAAKMAKPKAFSNFLPSASVSRTQAENNYIHPQAKAFQQKHTRHDNLTISQPLFDGGASVAQLIQAQSSVDGAYHNLKATANQIGIQVVQAYEQVLAAREIYQINLDNEKIFSTFVDYTKTRFEAGVVTKTDVLQSEVQYLEAVASREKSYSDLLASEALFERLVGLKAPEKMDPVALPEALLPKNVDEFLMLAFENNPSLRVAQNKRVIAKYGINVSAAAILPTVKAQAQFSRSAAPANSASNPDSNTYLIQMSMPLFQGGKEYADIKEKAHLSEQSEFDLRETERELNENVIKTWNAFKSNKATVISYASAVDSALLALDGVKEETNIGTKTTIDLLNAQRDVFNARIGYRNARTTLVTSAYQILQILGQIDILDLEANA